MEQNLIIQTRYIIESKVWITFILYSLNIKYDNLFLSLIIVLKNS